VLKAESMLREPFSEGCSSRFTQAERKGQSSKRSEYLSLDDAGEGKSLYRKRSVGGNVV